MAQLLWLRNDLRLHDHAGFALARQQATTLAVVYIVPQHWLQPDAHGMQRLGEAKKRFLQQCLYDLSLRLQAMGLQLQVFCGHPPTVLAQLVAAHGIQCVLTAEAQAPEEQAWMTALQQQGIAVHSYSVQTLFSAQQVQALGSTYPSPFTRFRQLVEAHPHDWQIEPPQQAAPLKLPALPLATPQADFLPTESHTLAGQVGSTAGNPQPDWRYGGETAALAWWQHYLLQQRAIDHYKQTRNQLLGEANSSKLSAYLAWGCLSVRQVWHDIVAYEAAHGSSESRYWLRFELLWREYFHWSMRHHGSRLFRYRGLAITRAPASGSTPHWQAWCSARTGIPMVDAGLLELQQTGYVSNRLRQNMASYFIHQLRLDWRLGAAWFEQYLLDFDVASNYGNWAYLAGVGHDPKPQRQFNLNWQLQQYDPDLSHIRRWLPQLAACSLHQVQQHQNRMQVLPDYPAPVVALPA